MNHQMRSAWIPGCILTLLLCAACSNFRVYTDTERKDHLERGEILSYLKNIQNTKLAIGESQTIVDAPPKRVWNCITDYNRQAEIGPRTKKIEITRIEGNVCWVDMILDAPWPMEDAVFTLKVEHDKKALRTNWSLVEGNIRESYGSWDVDPIAGEPNRSLVTYTLLYDDGHPVPRWLVNTVTRWAVHDVMKVLRNHVHDPAYDKPVYSISVLDPALPSNDLSSLTTSSNSEKRDEAGEPKLDEETTEILR